MNELQQKIADYIDSHREEMIADIVKLCRIDSVRRDAEKGAPFGPGARKVLDEMLQMCAGYGFAVRDYDGYVGTADFSDAEKQLDILAHLDVVPVGDDWTVTKPFEPKLVGDDLYGRGTSDDKGPAVAALYAMRAVKELGIPLQKSVRLIFGTDEECGSSDIEHYYEIEKEAPMTFSPDADFPLINIEKGMCRGHFTKTFAPSTGTKKLISFEAGGTINVVPGKAYAVIEGISIREFAECAAKAYEVTGASFSPDIKGDRISILCEGVGAHAAHPAGGNNALTAMMYLLSILPFDSCEGIDALRAIRGLLPHGDYLGKALGVQMEDELSGELTLSFTIYRQTETEAEGYFDSRVPICADEKNMRDVAAEAIEKVGFTFDRKPMVPPHHVSADSDFVRTLLACYEAYTGEKGEPMAIGGGTYVHELKNGVAFGCGFEGVDNHMHGADEYVRMKDLIVSAKIFALSIVELCG